MKLDQINEGDKSGWESLVEIGGQGARLVGEMGGEETHMERVERPGMKSFLSRFLQWV